MLDVLLVEDHDPTRRALARALRSRGLTVRDAGDAAGAVALAEEHAPDLALVDLRLGGASGVDVIRALAPRGIPCLALTQSDDAASLEAVVRAGGRGFLRKDDPLPEVLAALHRAVQGDRPISPSMTRHLLGPLEAVEHGLPYDLEVGLARSEAVLRADGASARWSAPAHVAALWALGRRWADDPPGPARGWLDDADLQVAVWGARHRQQGTNNLHVLLHRIRGRARDAGLDGAFLHKTPGRTRLDVRAVRLRGG